MQNLHASIKYHAMVEEDRAAVYYGDRQISYGEFYDRIRRVSALMVAQGIGRDDVIALFMKNSPAFLEIAYAASYIGAIFLPINFRLAAAEVEFILNDAKAKLLFVDEEFSACQRLKIQTFILSAEMQGDIRELTGTELPVPEAAVRGSDDLVRLMYTSGTTSHPKGVMHTYNNFYWKSIDHVIALGLSREDKLLMLGPMYHVGAFDLPGVAVLWVGGALCIHREFDPVAALASIERHCLTGAWMAPVMLNRILAVEDHQRFDLSSLRWCIGGGEKTPDSRIRDFCRVFANGRYIDAFGMTETCSGDTLMEAGWEFKKIGSTGRALPHLQIEIRDTDGSVLPPNTDGEICIRGPKVTKGYWNDPIKTALSFYGDWLRSGDIGHLDEDGFLYLTDRAKDMIITGAENVASSEVENVLYQMPQVAEAAVIGAPDERWGERIVAVVVPKPGETLTFDAVEAHCRKYLAGFKVPRELRLVASLPRTPSGKVLKRTLREEYKGG